MEVVLRELRQLFVSINESIKNSKKILVVISNISDTVGSIVKRLDRIEDKIEKLEKK